jgi:cytochrome c oxidase assembly factor CtaG/putative copper export protein
VITPRASIVARGLPPALGAALAVVACLAVLKYGGAIQAAKDNVFGLEIGSTPWLLPLAKLAMQLGAVVTVGCLVAAAFLVPGAKRGLLRGAAVAAACWAAAAVATMALTISDLLGAPVSEAVDADSMVMIATTVESGRGLATVFVLASVLATVCWFVRTPTGAALTAGIAVVATLPPAFSGHAAGAANHQLAVSLMILHVLGAVLWTGGLLALLLARRHAATAVPRFSRLAVCSFVAVAISGLASAALRLSEWNQFASGYGVVLLAKIGALATLGGFGWWHRRRSIPALRAGEPRAFVRVATVEVLVMAAAVGLAAGLARTQPPDDPHAAALIRTPFRAVLNWSPDPLFAVLAVTAIGVYLVGVRRLGWDWPWTRTAAWIAGWITVAAATDLQLARTIDHTFLLVEKVQHVAIVLVAPVLLVNGGGVALARRALRPGGADLRGPREWLDALLGSRALKLAAHPAATLALYSVALHGMYASALYTLTLRSHAGHLAAFAAALLVGGLFYWPLLGILPAVRELPHQVRMAQFAAATLLQLVFGLGLARTAPLAEQTAVWAVATALLVTAVFAMYRPDVVQQRDVVQRRADSVGAALHNVGDPAGAGDPPYSGISVRTRLTTSSSGSVDS